MSGVDGLNLADPGITLLADALRGVPASDVLLLFTGDVPGVSADATRLILDVRERNGVGPQRVDVELDVPGPSVPSLRVCAMWPRAHLGKDFTQQTVARAALLLPPGGRLLCAVRKQKGADSLARFLGQMFGDVRVVARDRGYRMLECQRGNAVDEDAAWELMRRRYRIDGPDGMPLRGAPGVFSRRELDAGTRCLIEHAARLDLEPTTVLDLGCGAGPLALWAAHRFGAARVTAVDTNLIAAALTRENDGEGRLRVLAQDGIAERFDLVLTNPPTHADTDTLTHLFAPLHPTHLLAVATRPEPVVAALAAAGFGVTLHRYDRYTVLQGR